MIKTYTIGEIAERFGVHKDTLRNWEKDGLVVPDRVGPRGDRVYTDEHLAQIVDKKLAQSVSVLGNTANVDTDMMSLAQLKTFLWKSADILRGKIDSSDYKKYIFGLLFYKRMSDVWHEEYDKALAEYHDDEIARADYNHRFQVPEDARWEVVQNTAADIGLKLNEVFDKITNANSPKLDKIFDDLDFANSDRFPNETLQRLINHFSKHKFGENYFSSDVLGDAYEYLIQQFAADAGKKGGEFYTPREVERLIMHILKPHEKDHIYDPAVGSGGFLLEAYHYTREKEGEQKARSLYLYGQEINISTYAIGKINMFLHGLDGADIRRGDTLADPQFLTPAGALKTFDIVVANFPYSIKDWSYELFKNDRFGRNDGYETPPAKNADFAFILHIIKSLNENGRSGVVVPHGVLSRGGIETRLREKIVEQDLIETIIALPPKLFYGTGIPAAVLIINKNKPSERKGKILFIDAEADYEPGKNQNRLRKSDLEKISTSTNAFESVEHYSEVVSNEEIAQNNYSLTVRTYVQPEETNESIDTDEVLRTLRIAEEKQIKLENSIKELVSDIAHSSKASWSKKKISEIADVVTGGTPSTSRKDYWDGDIQWMSSGEVNNGNIYKTKRNITKLGMDNSNARLLPERSVMIALAGQGKTRGKAAILRTETTCNQSLAAILPSDKYDSEYLYHNLSSRYTEIRSLSGGEGRSGLNLKMIKNIEISLPDIETQQKIARVLNAVDESVRAKEEIIDLTLKLKKGLMQNLLSGESSV